MAKSFNFRDEALELVSRGAWPQMLTWIPEMS